MSHPSGLKGGREAIAHMQLTGEKHKISTADEEEGSLATADDEEGSLATADEEEGSLTTGGGQSDHS